MTIVDVTGYDETKKILGVMSEKQIFVYFRGSTNSDTQKSWCPDCVKCDANVNAVLRNDDHESLICNVGFKEEWKDPENPFRKDEKLKVTSIPTLLNVSTGERITDMDELAKPEVVKNFLHHMNELETQSSRPIVQLPPDVVNKIAAGEVVVRPMNAVKELVENALDSGATEITVTVKNGGLDIIRVKDNGCGILPADYERVCERHSTSKLTKLEDLQSMKTLGFRGEALAALSCVAKVHIISRPHNCIHAWSASYQDCKPYTNRCISAGLPGTQITAEKLYHNLARREVFSRPKDQTLEIASLMVKYAINFPYVAFAFVCEDTGLKSGSFRSPGSGDQHNVIRTVLSSELSKDLYDFEVSDTCLRFSARFCMAHPLSTYTSTAIAAKTEKRKIFQLFINNRLVTSEKLKKSINLTFNSMDSYCPFMAITMFIDPSCVDVNAHPTKETVIFLNEAQIVQRIDEKLMSIMMKFKENGIVELDQLTGNSTIKSNPGPFPTIKSTSRTSKNVPSEKTNEKSNRKRKNSSSQTTTANSTLKETYRQPNTVHVTLDTYRSLSQSSSSNQSKKIDPKMKIRVDGRNHRIEEFCTPVEAQCPYPPSLPPGEITIDEVILDDTSEDEDFNDTVEEQNITLYSNHDADTTTNSQSESQSQFRSQCLSDIRADEDPELTQLLKNFVFVGFVDTTRCTFQAHSTVYLMDSMPFLEDIFYQKCIRAAGRLNGRRLFLNNERGGVSMLGLVDQYLQQTGKLLPNEGVFASQSTALSTYLTRFHDEDVLQRLWMDFGVCLQWKENELRIWVLMTLVEDYQPLLTEQLPRFAYDLVCINWDETEIVLVKQISRALARLHTPHEIYGCDEETQQQQQDLIQNRLFPHLKNDFIAPKTSLRILLH
ncbi:DNA-mis-repair domain-containing protein [Aphelenchoides besseyi]|nr:DNA-mis-repair domain-containing protein [Aphelenchoides besseyi]